MKGPLQGIRVLDASAGAVGPWAGALLGQLGAAVIKLESPQGDFIRNIMPAKNGLSVTYIAMNFNKYGLTLDLKKPEDRAMAHELAAEADVFIENFRPGVADRIGVGYAELSALNPRLVYASGSGFGNEGPMVKIGATDPHIQPFTGSCSVNGMPGGKRQLWRWYGHFDCTTAMCITEGVLSALLERETTGQGKHVLVSMTEAAMALQRVLRRDWGARASVRIAGLSPWTRRNFARWMFEDEPRAVVLTPSRWHRHFLGRAGAYRA